ncbi:bifunctional preprotein translocase subunit SecD/SecF [Spiroplasma sp. NBRC 100390]|uniref:protein translocase SecDF, variant type n=1 Tax=unclassified Spiroplasma TaxID=2637901 RepID=UPI000892834D|nr:MULTISPECIES: protein translocase SecDF, variant type [unclassified Spiroplasma]AOX43938.1 bifunctional preprotein translocase subunit SecD/SecF [Spiroplasma sp. TU-14]APE13408.1 bifunctional preprotein translocase subunit SecD/SecF [Spiroplasma sp. NBRC 100390]
MKKNEQITTIKEPKNKKAISKLIIRIGTLIVLIVAMIVGAYFSADSFRYSYKTGIAYSGGYQVQVNVLDKNDPNFSPDTPNGDSKKGLDLLRNKLDPLSNQNLYLQTLGRSAVEVVVGKDMFKSYNALSKVIQRLGAIYLTDSKGKDLLVGDNNGTKERTPLSDVISGSTTGVDQNRRPIITLKIKDQAKWDSIINSLKPSEGGGQAQPLYIWTDIGQFIDDLRHDTENIPAIATVFNAEIRSKVSASDWSNIYQIFNVEYYDAGTSQLRTGNLLDLALSYPISQVQTWMEDARFRFTSVPLDRLLIDPNDKTATTNQFIDPLRPYLQTIIEYNTALTDLYKEHIINWNSIKLGTGAAENSNQITTSTETESRQISNLINGGLSGLEFVIRGYREIPPVVSASVFKISLIILGVLVLAIFVVLLVYYRLFGFIAILTLLFTIIATLYFSSLLKVQISPESIAALMIAFGLALEGNLLFFSRYKRERYENQIPFEPAMKIANKQTIAVFIDALVVLIILGLSLFWLGTNNINSFATILLVGLIISIVMVFAVARLMYWIVIKLRWQEKHPWLDVSRFSLWKLFMKKRVALTTAPDALAASAQLQMPETSEPVIAANDNVATVIPKKGKQYKVGKWTFYNITKWTPVVGIILLIVALAIAFAGKANVANSIKPGINFTINQDLWGTNNDETAIAKLSTQLESIRKTARYNFSYNIYILKKQESGVNNRILVVSTNITKGTFERELLTAIASFYNATPDDPSLALQQTDPVMEGYILKNAAISIGVGLACIFVYTLFRLDWAQFVGMVLASLFALVTTIAIAIITQVLITFEMSIAFLAIFGFAIAFATMVMVRAKQNKKAINIREYETFFTYMSEHRSQIKRLRRAHKAYYQEELKKLAIKHPELTLREIKKQYHDQLKRTQLAAKDIKSKNNKVIREVRKDFRVYNYEHNFLQKVANITIKQMLQHCLTLGIMFAVLLITLAAFSGTWFGFNIVILIGLIAGMFATLFVGIPIWVALEKYRALNKIRVKNYLDSQRVEIDEQTVIGIND